VRRVSAPLLLLGISLAVNVKVKSSVLLGIGENIMSWPNKVARVPCIALGSRKLVPISLAKMFCSTSM
jgi:hypothetical protein